MSTDMQTIDDHLSVLRDGIRVRQAHIEAMEREVKSMQELKDEIRVLLAAVVALNPLATPRDGNADDDR